MSNWIKTHPDSPVRNSQSAGIGRVEAFGATVLINNLGRNIEISRFENGRLQRQRLYGETLYPDQDELSQFDLDMHSFLLSPDRKHLLALNHLGLLRVFEMPSLNFLCRLLWHGDVERTVMIDDCLVGSSPNGYATGDPAGDGIVIGTPWKESRDRIPYSFALADWGKVSAIEAVGRGERLAVAAGRHVGLFSLASSTSVRESCAAGSGMRRAGGIRIQKLLWETDLPFPVSWIKDSPAKREIFVSGEGAFAALSEESGGQLKQFLLKADLAWGSGAVPLALAGNQLIGADRLGGIYSWSLSTDSTTANVLLEPTASQSLGFAHMAICGDRILCGYNRGGYRLLYADIRPT